MTSHLLGSLLIVGAVTAAVGAFVVNSALGPAAGPRRHWLVLLGGSLTAATILLGAIQQHRTSRRLKTAEEVAVEAEEDLTLTLNAALAPITNYLGELADTAHPASRHIIVGQLLQAVVDAAVTLTASGSRSTFYVRDTAGKALSRVVWAGRSRLPRPGFHSGTPDGEFVLDLVERAELLVVDDVAAHPMVTPSEYAGYRTVIAVAVTAGERRLGLLTVDAPLPGDLTRTDVELVRVLANLLGSGLAQAS